MDGADCIQSELNAASSPPIAGLLNRQRTPSLGLEDFVTWSYRIVKTTEGFSVYDVFHDAKGRPVEIIDKPLFDTFCETPEGLLEQLETLKRAWILPPIDIQSIEGA